ncbi:MAG: NAD-dependent epimerase/dehydratase family protein [Verrucomicrobia bacterium]|nr:NAD-dependent epimerase/dehydratase family protein [Verrucomicrobiota bacterium]
MATALVTGGNGFLGSHLVESLVAQGDTVRCLVRRTSNRRWIRHLPVEYALGELRDSASLRRAVEGVETVYHVAAALAATSDAGFDAVNFHGTRALAHACIEANAPVRRFVSVSSVAACGPSRDGRPLIETVPARPVSAYGRSKLRGERALLELRDHLPITILRPPAIFGPRDPNLLPFFRCVRHGLRLDMGVSPSSVTDFPYVANIARAAVLAGRAGVPSGSIYLVGEGVGRTWREIGIEIARALGARGMRVRVPVLATRLLGALGTLWSKLSGRAMILDYGKACELLQPNWSLDITKARRELGYAPEIGLRRGIELTIEGYRAAGWL